MKTEVVAEVSNNHNGDLSRCFRLIDAAKKAGASSVKFQCFTPDELIALRGDGPAPEPWGSQGWTMRSLYEKAQTPLEWFPGIAAYCEKVGMPWFSSVFGLQSLALLESLGCPRYKIAAFEEDNYDLRKHVQATHKPVVVSSRRRYAPNWMSWKFLYCPEGYPQEKHHISYLYPGNYHGFSYHGTDPEVCVVAVAAGARMIECHFMLAEEPSELEANVSLNQYQLEQMVKDIERIEGYLE